MTGGPLRSALLTCLVLCCVPCGFAHIADVSLLTIFTDPSGVVSNVTDILVDKATGKDPPVYCAQDGVRNVTMNFYIVNLCLNTIAACPFNPPPQPPGRKLKIIAQNPGGTLKFYKTAGSQTADAMANLDGMGNFAPNAEVMTQSGFISPMGDPFMGFDFGPFQGDGSGIANVSITLDPTGVNGFGYGTYNIFAQGEIPQCFYFGVGNYSIFNTVTQNFVSYVRTYLPPINFTVADCSSTTPVPQTTSPSTTLTPSSTIAIASTTAAPYTTVAPFTTTSIPPTISTPPTTAFPPAYKEICLKYGKGTILSNEPVNKSSLIVATSLAATHLLDDIDCAMLGAAPKQAVTDNLTKDFDALKLALCNLLFAQTSKIPFEPYGDLLASTADAYAKVAKSTLTEGQCATYKEALISIQNGHLT